MKNELVSVILTAYNEEKEWFDLSVNSILTQTYKNLEILLIIDNPLNKILINEAKRFELLDSRVKVFINNENKGLVESLNMGINLCTGNFIARMDADDICELNRIQSQMEFLDKNPKCVIVGTQIKLIDEYGNNINKNIKLPKTFENIKNALRYRNVLCHPSILMRKDFIISIGLYRNVMFAEDYDLITRVIINGGEVRNLSDYLIKYRIRTTGITQSNKIPQIRIQQLIKKSFKKNQEYTLENLIIKSNKLLLRERIILTIDKIIYKLLIKK